MKILFVAPLPPPVAGHSLVSGVLFEDLARDNEAVAVNFNKSSFADGADSARRFAEVLGILWQVFTKKQGAARIYLTISESLLGNLKDLVIYVLCFRRLSTFYIHLHGGSIGRLLWDYHPLLYRLNRVFIRRLAGVIVSGPSHLPIFDGMLPPRRVHIVPNFAQEYLFATEAEIRRTFSTTVPLRVLYISNFIVKKGYNDLLDAFLGLEEELQQRLRIDFAGRFDTSSQEARFLGRIKGLEQLHYHGTVHDVQKRQLFVDAHVFCLPTALFEGQPISILEAYAAGCVVVTTGQSGIRDIFTDGINGEEIESESPASIRAALHRLMRARERLVHTALANNREARGKYRTTTYTAAIRRVVLEQRAPTPHVGGSSDVPVG